MSQLFAYNNSLSSLKDQREACQEPRFEIVVVNWRMLNGAEWVWRRMMV
jgi:hypothetical protein